MHPPPSTSAKRMLLAGSVMLALVAAGIYGWIRWPLIRTQDVASFLDKAVGSGRVRFSDLRIGVTRLDKADLQVNVAATARAPWPLYSRIDAAEYLRATLGLDPDSTADARRLIADNGASQGPEFSRLRPFPPDPYRAAILRVTTQAGASFAYHGVIAAHRDGNSWSLALVTGAYDNGVPEGEVRAAFADPSFVAGEAGDEARLRALTADLRGFAGRLSATRKNLEVSHAAGVNARREAFLARLKPGSVFRGVAQRGREQQGTALYLEITGLSAGNGATALLRNSGGWHCARAFQGSWSADEDFETSTLNLSSRPDQAIWNAGPFLENTQTWTFALRMDPKGSLSETNPSYQYQFQFLSPGEAASARSALDAEFERATAVTEPGSLYRGTAVSKATGASEPLLLRFTGRSDRGEQLDGRIESTTRSWKRPFHGLVVVNAKRSDGAPIRLRTNLKEAVEEAPADSVLGDRFDLDIRLGIENTSLAGEDVLFTYRFAPAEAGDLNSLNAARAARAGLFGGAVRDGIAYDGIIRDDQGSVTQARLEITSIDRKKDTIAASIHSLVLRNIYQDFLGTWDPSDASMALASTGRGEFDSTDTIAVPFLVAPVAEILQLSLIGNSITGGIKGDTHWAMEFPVGVFLSAPTEGADPGSPPAEASVFPAFPKGAGAYLLSAGAWRPLPRNNGRIVVETAHPMTDEEAATGALGMVSSSVRRLTNKGEKISYLEFDGKDPRPESAGPPVILLFIGPDLSRTPLVELAPAETVKDGRRRIWIAAGTTATIRFGEQRAAAYVRQAGPGAVLLTTTSALPPGAYAFNADAGYELTLR